MFVAPRIGPSMNHACFPLLHRDSGRDVLFFNDLGTTGSVRARDGIGGVYHYGVNSTNQASGGLSNFVSYTLHLLVWLDPKPVTANCLYFARDFDSGLGWGWIGAVTPDGGTYMSCVTTSSGAAQVGTHGAAAGTVKFGRWTLLSYAFQQYAGLATYADGKRLASATMATGTWRGGTQGLRIGCTQVSTASYDGSFSLAWAAIQSGETWATYGLDRLDQEVGRVWQSVRESLTPPTVRVKAPAAAAGNRRRRALLCGRR
jgi:hypothetical protein